MQASHAKVISKAFTPQIGTVRRSALAPGRAHQAGSGFRPAMVTTLTAPSNRRGLQYSHPDPPTLEEVVQKLGAQTAAPQGIVDDLVQLGPLEKARNYLYCQAVRYTLPVPSAETAPQPQAQ